MKKNITLLIIIKAAFDNFSHSPSPRHNRFSTVIHLHHQTTANYMQLFTTEASSSPTVTAILVPTHLSWTTLNNLLREAGVAVGGSYGDFAGKVFRIGHMGTLVL